VKASKRSKWAYPYHMLHEVCYYNGYGVDHLEKVVHEEYPKEAIMQLELGPRIRIERFDNEYSIYDMCDATTNFVRKLPLWMEESVSLLLLVESGEEVKNVGYRYNSSVFYLDRRGVL
jgi:hypothetical protein